MRKRTNLLIIPIAFLVLGCNALSTLSLSQKSPHENYLSALRKTDLDRSVMAREWVKAGDPYNHDSLTITLPYRESGFFPASEPQARFYKFDAKEGQVATLAVKIRSKEATRLFIDLFVKEDTAWTSVAWTDTTLSLSYEIPKSRQYLVRVQPELLVNVFYAIEVSTTPALIIPVKGATNKSIGSFYNDPRDINGKIRKHEGVDIFAPKGTPVIAPVDGYVSRVGTNSLGGKVVWMNDPKRGHSYYFAHLDSQIAVAGMKVKQGDVLGLVGNTGNAKYTPSHLHFGVYQNTSKDPLAYLKTMESIAGTLVPDTLVKSMVVRVSQKNVSLLAGSSKKDLSRMMLPKDSFLKVIAQSGTYYRVLTAENREGFIERTKVISAIKGNKVSLKKPVPLLTEADRTSIPQETINGTVEALASWKTYRYIKTDAGHTGWIDLAQAL